MEPFQKRLIDEIVELDERLGKLDDFIDRNPKFSQLDHEEQALQIFQRKAMEEYMSALMGRMQHQGLGDELKKAYEFHAIKEDF